MTYFIHSSLASNKAHKRVSNRVFNIGSVLFLQQDFALEDSFIRCGTEWSEPFQSSHETDGKQYHFTIPPLCQPHSQPSRVVLALHRECLPHLHLLRSMAIPCKVRKEDNRSFLSADLMEQMICSSIQSQTCEKLPLDISRSRLRLRPNSWPADGETPMRKPQKT